MQRCKCRRPAQIACQGCLSMVCPAGVEAGKPRLWALAKSFREESAALDSGMWDQETKRGRRPVKLRSVPLGRATHFSSSEAEDWKGGRSQSVYVVQAFQSRDSGAAKSIELALAVRDWGQQLPTWQPRSNREPRRNRERWKSCGLASDTSGELCCPPPTHSPTAQSRHVCRLTVRRPIYLAARRPAAASRRRQLFVPQRTSPSLSPEDSS